MKTSKPAHLPVVLHVTSCRRFAHATVGDLQIAFENPDAAGYPQKLAPNAFVATAARAQATGDDVALGEISAAVQASCAAALNKELAEHTGVEIHASEKYHAYYQHARSLGGFRAIDCFYLARQAAACDVVACAVTPSFVCNEGTQRLSFAIKVF